MTVKSDNVTKNRNNRKPVVVPQMEETPVTTITPDNMAPAPEGIILPTINNNPEQLSPSAAEIADKAANDASLIVPATPAPRDPNAPTDDQIAFYNGMMRRIWTRFYRARPIANESVFVPLTDDQVESAAEAYKAANGGTLRAAFAAIESQEADRAAAHAALIANAAPINDLWIDAGLTVLRGLELDLVNMRSKPPVKASRTVSKAIAADNALSGGTRKPSGTAAEKAARRVAYVQAAGLAFLDLIDQTDGGYEGTYHAMRLHPDGRYELLNYDPATRTATATGTFIDGWKAAFGDKAPKYSVDQMFGILDPDGKLGASLGNKKAHLADVKVTYQAADAK